MYSKELTEGFRLRLSSRDMDFLRSLSETRGCSVSEVCRSMIGDYRRGLQTIQLLSKTFKDLEDSEGGDAVHGNTETNIDDSL